MATSLAKCFKRGMIKLRLIVERQFRVVTKELRCLVLAPAKAQPVGK